MKEETREITKDGVKGALWGAICAAALSIVTGAALVATPVTILWGLITVATSVVIAPAVVAIFVVVGAVTGGVSGAVLAYRRIRWIDIIFGKMKNGEK